MSQRPAQHRSDPRAVDLRSALLSFASRLSDLTHPEMLDELVRIAWDFDLKREIVGAKAIAEAVFGDATPARVSRVKKFERDHLCKFRRWGGTIYLHLGEVMVLRHELEARGRLSGENVVPALSPRLNQSLLERTLSSTDDPRA